MWINRPDLFDNFNRIALSIPNRQLRDQIDEYFRSTLSTLNKPAKKDRDDAIDGLLLKYPEFIDYYIRFKEDTGDQANALSEDRIKAAWHLFVKQTKEFSDLLASVTGFYQVPGNTYYETHQRVAFLKDVIENQGGHRWFFVDGKPVRREADLQQLFKLVWFGTPSDVSPEVNHGRGSMDFKISRGNSDKTLVEFKIASNTRLKQNLQNQTGIYEKSSGADRTVEVITFFDLKQQRRVSKILTELNLLSHPDIILIDARADNKPSGSRA